MINSAAAMLDSLVRSNIMPRTHSLVVRTESRYVSSLDCQEAKQTNVGAEDRRHNRAHTDMVIMPVDFHPHQPNLPLEAGIHASHTSVTNALQKA